jgi:hypothetical protein
MKSVAVLVQFIHFTLCFRHLSGLNFTQLAVLYVETFWPYCFQCKEIHWINLLCYDMMAYSVMTWRHTLLWHDGILCYDMTAYSVMTWQHTLLWHDGILCYDMTAYSVMTWRHTLLWHDGIFCYDMTACSVMTWWHTLLWHDGILLDNVGIYLAAILIISNGKKGLWNSEIF